MVNNVKEVQVQEVQQQWREFSTSIFVEGPNKQTVLVLDPFKKSPMDKYPGGKGDRIKVEEGGKEIERMETPTECAVRELWGETGLSVKEEDLFFITAENRGTHDFYFFKVSKPDFEGLRERGDEGELVKIVPISKLLSMETFLYSHKILLEEAMFMRIVDIE